MKVAIWLDDERDPKSDEWKHLVTYRKRGAERVIWAADADAFEVEVERAVLDGHTITSVMFDIYLGYGYRTGHEAFAWLESYVKEMGLPPFRLYCHSQASLEERFQLKTAFRRLQAYWKENP